MSLKELLTRFEVEQDFCRLRYGETTDDGVCNAVLGETGQRKCYQTRPTCQDPDQFNPFGRGGLIPEGGAGSFSSGAVATPSLDDFTFETLIRADVGDTPMGMIWISGTNNFALRWGPDDDLQVRFSSVDVADYVSLGGSLKVGHIHHVLIERYKSSNRVVAEIDGEQVGDVTDASFGSNVGGESGEEIMLMNTNDADSEFIGTQDESRIWDKILSESFKETIRFSAVAA